MGFKLTFSDGHETEYDDNTKWEVENGVVKMGREAGKWTAFLSPSHWATLELTAGKDGDKGEDESKDDDSDEARDKDKDDKDKDDKDKDDKDKKDEKDDKDKKDDS